MDLLILDWKKSQIEFMLKDNTTHYDNREIFFQDSGLP